MTELPKIEPRRILLLTGAIAVIVRLLYLTEQASSAFFGVAILDEKFYDLAAQALLGDGDLAGLNPGFRPLLYPLFLAIFYRLGGESGTLLALLAQHALGATTAVLVAWLAIRLFERPLAGLLAGVLYVLAGPPLYFEGERLIVSLFTFLIVLLLVFSVRAFDRPPQRNLVAFLSLGAFAGLAIQARANALLFLLLLPLGHWLSPRRLPRKTMLTTLASALAIHFACSLLPLRYETPWTLFPGAGGVNFYLGNKPGADGMIPRQDRAVVQGDTYRDSVQVFAEETYRTHLVSTGEDGTRPLSPGEISRYWYGETLGLIVEDPGRWIALLGRKVRLLLWNAEIPNNKSYAFIVDHESNLLRLLPVRWWLLLVLAPFGVALAWRHHRALLFVLLGLMVLHGAGIVLFFVNSRFRLPLWPGMAILAAGGLLALYEVVARKRPAEIATGLGLLFGLALVTLTPPSQTILPSAARDFFFRSLANLEQGRLAAARSDIEASLRIDTNDAAAHFQYGNTALAQDDFDTALQAFSRAAELKPDEPLIFNNLGVVLEELGRPGEAYVSYREAILRSERHSAAWVNLALLELRAGLPHLAAAKVERARTLGDRSVALLYAQSLLEHARSNPAEAELLLGRARRQNSAAVERLVLQQTKRLQPADLQPPTLEEEPFQSPNMPDSSTD